MGKDLKGKELGENISQRKEDIVQDMLIDLEKENLFMIII